MRTWEKIPTRFLILAGVLIGLGVGLALFFLVGPGLNILSMQDMATIDQFLAPEINQIAPDFGLKTLDGGLYRLSTQTGKPVVVNFWATWCLPCKEEMPLLNQFAKENDQVEVVGINFDESEGIVKEFVESNGIDFPILLDSGGEVVKLFRIQGFPATLFIDEDRVLRYQHVGLLNQELLENYVQQLGLR